MPAQYVTITGASGPGPGGTWEVYGGLTAVSAYIAGLFGPPSTTFGLLTTNDQSRVLLACCRFIDSFGWQGTQEGAAYIGYATTMQFPRSNLNTPEGTFIPEATQLALVQQAVSELCALVALDPSILQRADQNEDVGSIGADGEHVTYNRPLAQDGEAPVLPVAVMRLIGQWLSSTSPGVTTSAAMGSSHGTHQHSDFDRHDEHRDSKLGWPV